MQSVGSQLEAVLDARNRKLTVLYEIYASDYDSSGGFNPLSAERTFAAIAYTLPYGPTVYKRQVLSGETIDKTIKKKLNSVSIKFSNVDEDIDGSRYMAKYVLSNVIEGKKLVVRLIDRSVAAAIGNNSAIITNSLVVFAGKCSKPDGFNRSVGTISAKQDLGTIEALAPARQFQRSCPLEFKGEECLGTETLGEKSAAYQAAGSCNFSFRQCSEYENTEFFQGTRIVQITSSFVHKSHMGFFDKLRRYAFGIGGLLASKRRTVTVNNSTHDGTPYGEAVPDILGRWYKELIPLQYQDVGTSIKWKGAACRGPIHDIINLRNESPGFTSPFNITKHFGEYGGADFQQADTMFPDQSFHSRLAYATGECAGSNIEIEEPAPTISAVIAGALPEQIYVDVDHDGTGKLATGSGGVSAAGSSTTPPADPAVSFDAALFEIGTPEYYFKVEETVIGAVFPTIPGGMIDSSGNGNHAWHVDAAGGGPTILDISTPEVPVQTDPASRFNSGPIGALAAASGSSLDPRGTQTWIAIARMTSHTSQSYILNKGSDTVGGVPFGMSFGLGAGTQTLFVSFGNGSIDGGGALSYGPIIDDGRPYLIVFTREQNALRLYVNGCLVDSIDNFPTGDIVHADFNNTGWRFGYTQNLAFGPVFLSQGASRFAMFNGEAATPAQVSRLWASMRTIPTGCPGRDWTDNPVDHTRWLLTEPSALNLPSTQINDHLSAYAAAWNCGAIRDDTNAERGLLPNSEVSRAGVDYQRYTSTGLLGPLSFESTRTQIPAGVPARALSNVGSGGNAIGEFEFFDPSAPPTSLDTLITYRKRFTCNLELTQSAKVFDVIYDRIFPTFGGFFKWDARGRIVIDSERPTDWTKLELPSLAGATTLTVQDVLPWKTVLGSPYLLEGKVHLDRALTWSYPNALARTGAAGFVAGDVGKYALQKDNQTIWRLTATTPTWVQETTKISEVRPVTLAQYSSLGDAITLAASASGGPTATASGATLTGGSTTVQSSGTVTLTGSLANGSTITVTIDGVACVLDLVTGESSSTIGHRMACVINATPEINGYVEAHAAGNVVTIYSKIGVLTLASALEEAHSAETEITRVMASFAGKALTYADTTRANILDGSFEWPEAGRQPVINQIKATHREAILDFAEFPIVVDDFDHQRSTSQTNPHEPDHSGIDNYNQNARRSNSLLNKFRDGDKFYRLGSTGRALLLEEGDVITCSHDSGNYRNVLMRIEDVQIKNGVEAFFVCRHYSRDQFSDLVPNPVDAELPSGLSNFEAPPPDIAFNQEDFPPSGLSQSTDGTAGITSIRGGVIFGASIYAQYAKVRLIKRGGVTVNESINDRLERDEDFEGVFEFIASTEGIYEVQAQACNQWGCSAAVTALIVVGLGAAQGDWITPMVQFSGAGDVAWSGVGTYTIPMITESAGGDPEPAGGGNYDIP